MSFKTFIRNLTTLARADTLSTFTGSNVTAAQAFGSGAISSLMQVPGASRPAENVILAYACIAARREAIGGQSPMLQDANKEALSSGPARDLLDNPNAAQDWDQFVRVLETHQTLHNCCAVHLLPDNARPELTPLNPEGLQAIMGIYVPAGTARVVRWRYVDPTTAEQREFAPEDVVIRMGYNPHAPLSALSPTRVLDRTIKGDIAAREQNLGIFQNDATPRGYLHTDAGMTKEQALQVLDVWNSAQQGFLNRHKTAALWGGVKYDRIQLSPAELEFMESLRQSRIDFYMAFRVYPAMLAEMTGETGLSQGSSTDNQRIAWWEDVGLPELKLMSGIVTEAFKRLGLLPEGASISYNPASIPALARQRLGKIDQAAKLLTAGYEPDAVNEYLDLQLPPHPDNIGRVPFSLQPIGEGAAEPKAIEGEANQVPESAPSVKSAVPASASSRAEVDVAFSRVEQILSRSPRAPSPDIPAHIARMEALEKKAAQKWSRFFIEQRGRVLGRLEKLARNEQVARAASEPASVVFSVFPREAEDKALVARMNPTWIAGLQTGWDQFSQKTGIANPFQIEAPSTMRALEARKIQGMKVNDTTEEALRDVFRTGFEEGKTLYQLSDDIAAYYADHCEGFDSARAMNAATTQTTGIVNDGELLAAREAGGLRKFWIHAEPNEGSRPTHIAAARDYSEGQAIALDDKFRVGGEELDAPGDPSASPENVCNCHCMLGFARDNA